VARDAALRCGQLEQVAGLFYTREEAELALKAYGSFEWLW
jgi:hypothetical protein